MAQRRLIPEEQLPDLRTDELPDLLDCLMNLTGPDLAMRRSGLRRMVDGV